MSDFSFNLSFDSGGDLSLDDANYLMVNSERYNNLKEDHETLDKYEVQYINQVVQGMYPLQDIDIDAILPSNVFCCLKLCKRRKKK